MIDETTKFNRAEGYYKRDASMGNVDGAWKNFVAMVQEPRNMYANGQLVQPNNDGSRPGYSGKRIDVGISKSKSGKFEVVYKGEHLGTYGTLEEAKEIYNFEKEQNPRKKSENPRLDPDSSAGKIRIILDSYLAEGKTSYTFKEVLESGNVTTAEEESLFRKNLDGVKKRDKKYSKLKLISSNLLSEDDRLKIMSNFDLPEGQTEWLFDKYKYGVDGIKNELLAKRIKKNISLKTEFPLAASFSDPKGWMSHSMYRVFKNQTEEVIGPDGEPTGRRIPKKGVKLTYEPLYGENDLGVTKIVGFKDNTAAGKGGEFYALKKYETANAASWDDHLDYEKVKKMVDITKRVGQKPSDIIQKLLTEKGFKNNVRLNDILSYDRYYTRLGEVTPQSLLRSQIVKHHSGGVAARDNLNAAATKDIQLLTGANNSTAVYYENIVNGTKKNAPRPLTTAENNILKNIGVKITGMDGMVYGGGSLDPDKQFALIEKQAADMVKKDTFTQEGYKKYLKSLENDLVALCPRDGKSSGGRIGFNLGSGAACGAKFLEEKLKDGKGTPKQRTLMANIISKGAAIKNFTKSALNPLELLNPKNYLGPQAIALMGAFEVGDVTYDVINNNKPIKEALGDNWILKYASPYNQEEEQVKAVESKNISGSPAMQTYMKKVKLQAEFQRENKKLEKLKKDTPSKNNPKVQEQIKEQQAVVDGLVNNWEQFVTDSTVNVNGEKVLTLESGKQDFEQAFGQIIEKRGAGEYVPADDKQSLMKTYMEGPSENKYINTGSDLINQGDSLSYKYKKDSGKDQGRNLSETEREALKLFPFEQGSLRADYTPLTYKDFNYTPQKLPAEIRQKYENEATKRGILPPRTSLSQTPMPDGSTYDYLKDLTELYNNPQKAEQASRFPGYSGTQEPAKYATGGIANTRIGFKTGSSIASILSKFFKPKPKKTITVKRGESGTIGASGNANKDFFDRYYFPPEGGFTNQSADARYFSKLGGPEGNPKVLTAEITPAELKEGYRLRSLDSKDPEIGDIILPESAKNKIKTDYYNTIRAKVEKMLKE
jgi:hypothetical protein